MDDSEPDVALMFPRKEINGNLSTTSQPCQPEGSDEVDSPRVFLPQSLCDTDGSSRSTLSSRQRSLCKIGVEECRNDNEDDGYCSPDQMQHRDASRILQSQRPRCTNSKNIESAINNNISELPRVYPPLGDATGKVLGVSMPPSYIVRSNETRTTFRPNLNEMASGSGDSAGICLREIPSRRPVKESQSQNQNSVGRRGLPVCEPHLRDGSYGRKELNDNENFGGGSQRKISDGTSSDEAGAVIVKETNTRKRKGRDEADGDDALTKRHCREGMAVCQPVQAPLSRQHHAGPSNRYDIQGQANSIPTAPLSRQHHAGPSNHYDIQGQANWVVQEAQNCTFHIYQTQTQGTNGGQTKQHFVDWAGVSIHQVNDAKLKRAFEETSKAISQVFNWKRFARLLPMTHSPTLEQDLRDLESCSGSTRDKSLAVLLRWWRGDCKGSHGEDVRLKLKEGLVDCGLRRMARDLDKIFQESI